MRKLVSLAPVGPTCWLGSVATQPLMVMIRSFIAPSFGMVTHPGDIGTRLLVAGGLARRDVGELGEGAVLPT